VIDSIGQIGVDPGTEWGTGLTSTADNTLRRKASVEAGDPNTGDAFDPAVEWDGFATDTFDGLGAHGTPPGDAAPRVDSTTPANNASDVARNANVSITFSEPVNVTGSWFTIACADTGAHTAVASGGPTTFTLDPDVDFGAGETCTVTVIAAQVADQDANDPPDTMASNATFSFTTVGVPARIREIQGAAHLSPLNNVAVSNVPGVVTARASNGFWFQDPTPDADPATSEGVFVFTSSAPPAAAAVGQAVMVSGRVQEFRAGCTPSCDPGSSAFDNLTVTEIVNPVVTAAGPGAAIPVTIIGAAGRIPPATVIENDSAGNVETSNTFDPAQDGIDFYESLEGMSVGLDNAVATGPRNSFGEISLIGDNGASASPRTNRGGVVVSADDFNPERVIIDDVLASTPVVDTNDRFATVRGVMDYGFGNFKLQVTSSPAAIDGGLQRETTGPQQPEQLTVGSFNVENLDPRDPPAKFAELAGLIVNNLRSPDIVGVQEIQDNDGPTNSGTVDASQTFAMLIAAIEAAGGPTYDWRSVNPVDGEDGGEPGGNIRVGALFNPDRVRFEDKPGATATTANEVVNRGLGTQLLYNPGRIDPTNPAFEDSRKPLAMHFKFHGERVFVIVNHFNSKGGDDPLFGRFQPPVRSSEVQRHAQAAVVNDFVDRILDASKGRALIVVLGDLNDFEFSETLDILDGDGALVNLMGTLPKAERYSYVFDGNSQVLDQMLVSQHLFDGHQPEYDVVHVNAEFADQASDHDPQVARFVIR
jgi:predicted extracellular nuclease